MLPYRASSSLGGPKLPRPLLRLLIVVPVLVLLYFIGGQLMSDRAELHELREKQASGWSETAAAMAAASGSSGGGGGRHAADHRLSDADLAAIGRQSAVENDKDDSTRPVAPEAPAGQPPADLGPSSKKKKTAAGTEAGAGIAHAIDDDSRLEEEDAHEGRPVKDKPHAAAAAPKKKPAPVVAKPKPAPPPVLPPAEPKNAPLDPYFKSRLSSPPFRLTDPRWDKYVIGLKSGIEVAADKVPIQLATFLQGVRNIYFFGDGVMRVGDYEMTDVITGAYDKAVEKLTRLGTIHKAHEWSDSKKKFEKNNRERAEREAAAAAKKKAEKAKAHEKHPNHGGLQRRGAKDQDVKPNESSKGWKMDAHKNIPAMREMYKAYPNAEWFVMIDDDTYLFMENLHRVLSGFNSSMPYYIGSPTHFRDCDGVKVLGSGPMFNHGGSGIILSREALRRMVNIADECIVRYNDCWAGDVRLGLCMRDAGILASFNHLPRRLFNPVTPHWSVHPYFDDPCQRVASFHHLSAASMQKLYDIERSVARRTQQFVNLGKLPAKLNRTLARHLFFPNGTQPAEFAHLGLPEQLPSPFSAPIHLEDIWHEFVDNDKDLPEIEHDIARTNEFYLVWTGTKNPGHCRWLCEKDKKCRAWHYEPSGRCEMKDSITRAMRKKGSASGMIKNRFYCNSRSP
ncbi:hypothetical protein BC828DRAFT_412802 [Blastocladiella britannica]|nr:hypothetical protein BC828DRAFT_412802 [Blastocladiella britannica]